MRASSNKTDTPEAVRMPLLMRNNRGDIFWETRIVTFRNLCDAQADTVSRNQTRNYVAASTQCLATETENIGSRRVRCRELITINTCTTKTVQHHTATGRDVSDFHDTHQLVTSKNELHYCQTYGGPSGKWFSLSKSTVDRRDVFNKMTGIE